MSKLAAEPSTRARIVEAADVLFYQQGFEKTSFADIADAVQLSRGNFYYHFKTKDDILDAVIALRAARTQLMLESWAWAAATPVARLRRFAEMLIQNRHLIQRYGCPVGTLCTELIKLDHPARGAAGMIFVQFRGWLRDQFEAMNHGQDSDALAMHLLSRSQGIAAVSSAFQDEAFIKREVDLIEAWLVSLDKNKVVATRSRRKSS